MEQAVVLAEDLAAEIPVVSAEEAEDLAAEAPQETGNEKYAKRQKDFLQRKRKKIGGDNP